MKNPIIAATIATSLLTPFTASANENCTNVSVYTNPGQNLMEKGLSVTKDKKSNRGKVTLGEFKVNSKIFNIGGTKFPAGKYDVQYKSKEQILTFKNGKSCLKVTLNK